MGQRTQALGRTMKKFPLLSFIVLLGVLLGVIVLGSAMRTQEVEQEMTAETVKNVTVYVPHAAQATVSGAVDNGNVVTLRATTSGIVSRVYVREGQSVARGAQVVTLADNYSGGSVAAVVSKSAQLNAQMQAEISEKNLSIYDDQRDDVSGDGLAAEIARKQLTIQKRNAELAQTAAQLEQQRAAVAAAAYYPRAPFAGTIERVFVDAGERVSMGDPIAVISGIGAPTTVTVTVDRATAQHVSVTKPSEIMIVDEMGTATLVTALPAYVSQAPTSGQAYSIVYVLDTDMGAVHGSFVDVTMPLEQPAQGVYVPLDAVSVTNDGAVIFVVRDGHAAAQEVTLGAVSGDVVLVQGLSADAQVIMERSVFDGDPVQVMDAANDDMRHE